MGSPVPARILDLFTEFRNATNGIALPGGRGLIGALSYHGIPAITKEQKTDDRDLVLRGGPWTTSERRRILDYGQSDVDQLTPLLERMLPRIRSRTNWFGHALLRRRYVAAAARMVRAGVPNDRRMLQRLRMHWGGIKRDLLAAIDKDYGVYHGTMLKAGKFAKYLHDNKIDWPRAEAVGCNLIKKTFRDMARRYPQLEPLSPTAELDVRAVLPRSACQPWSSNTPMIRSWCLQQAS